MGLFDKLFNKTEKEQPLESYWQTLTAYRPVFHSWSGEIYESELVRSAIDAKARHISKLKVEFRGTAKPTLLSVVKHAPNSWQTWSQFLYRLSTILEAQNTAFIVPVFDDYNRINGYYPILPSETKLLAYKDVPYLQYHFRTGGTAAIELKLCGIMTKYQYRDDFFGDSNKALIPTMDLIKIQRDGITEAVKNSNTFRFIAQMDNFAKAGDLAKEQGRFSETNLRQEGGVLLFPNNYKNIKQVDSKPYTVDAEQSQQIRENVQNYFGVNEDVMQGKALGDSLDAFFNSSIEPFSIQLSDVLTKMTYTLRERSEGNEVVVSANRLQYMPTSSKIQMVQQLGDRGMMTINEGRELFNYPPIEGGDVSVIRGEYYETTNKLEGGNDNGNQDE